MATDAISDMLRQKESPAKKSMKGGAKESVAILVVSMLLGCVSQDSYPRRSILREPGKCGRKHAVKFSRGTWHQIKNRKRKGPSQGIIQQCALHERRPCEETLHQERCARKAAWDLAKIFTSSRIRTEPRSLLRLKQREFVVDSRASMHMMSKKELSSRDVGTGPEALQLC